MLPNRTPILIEIGIVHVLETIRPDQLLLVDFVKVLYALLGDCLLTYPVRHVYVVLLDVHLHFVKFKPISLLLLSAIHRISLRRRQRGIHPAYCH